MNGRSHITGQVFNTQFLELGIGFIDNFDERMRILNIETDAINMQCLFVYQLITS